MLYGIIIIIEENGNLYAGGGEICPAYPQGVIMKDRNPTLQRAILRISASAVLLELGFETHRKGFRYCRDAILMLAEDPTLQVTKTVYPAVGKQYFANGQSVEKAIRASVAAAWEERDERIWRLYFPGTADGQVVRPTNAELLTRIANAIAMGDRTAHRGGQYA